jgi:hypothetical protein
VRNSNGYLVPVTVPLLLLLFQQHCPAKRFACLEPELIYTYKKENIIEIIAGGLQ